MRWSTLCRTLALLEIAAVGGCVVGPDYHPTAPRAPATWASPLTDEFSVQASAASWWGLFNDVELDSLIQRAIPANLDLRVAEARLRQARAVRGGSAADLMPAINASGSAARAKQSKNQPFFGALALPPNFPFEYSVYQAGFDASWELDVFGGKHRALEAATADWESAIEARNDTMVSLLAEVGRTYIELRGTQERLQIAQRNLALQREALQLIRARVQGGIATSLDVTRSAALLADLMAAIPPLETVQRAAMYGMAVLLGQSPGDLVTELSIAAALPPVPAQVPVGLPSDLLRRRPDVRRAERQLAAETARIGVAKSDWFPKLSLTGDVGQEGVTLAKWFEPGSQFWSIGPSLQWKALDFGRVRAEVRAQTAVQEGALATYQKAVLVALQETENAMVAYAQEQNRHRALIESVAQNRQSLQLADSLYEYGRITFLDVLDVRRSLYQADDELAVSDQAISVDLIALYKSLGGGWETLPLAPVTTTDARP
jgi:outer membrane protein, multidrug efflux system